MSTVCQQKSREPNRRGRVVALDDFRMHRLALVIADELRRHEGSTWRPTNEFEDVAMWRRAARRAGLGLRVGEQLQFYARRSPRSGHE